MSKTIAKTMFGRKVKEEISFPKEEGCDFGAYYMATRHLRTNGYKVGSMDYNNPVHFYDWNLSLAQKWHNLDAADKRLISGVILSEDFRNESVKIIFFE